MAGAWKILLAICLTASLLLAQASAGGDHRDAAAAAVGWVMPSARSGCKGTVAECLGNEDEEFEMDSESNRRILATRRFISYGALDSDSVPCSRRGASYYNCRPGAQANPYNRGCSAITQCRS